MRTTTLAHENRLPCNQSDVRKTRLVRTLAKVIVEWMKSVKHFPSRGRSLEKPQGLWITCTRHHAKTTRSIATISEVMNAY